VVAVLDGLVAGLRGLQIIAELDPELSARLRQATAKDAAMQLSAALSAAGIDPAAIRPRVLRLPVDLVVHDLFNGAPSPDPREIVDEIFLPLLRLSQTSDPDAGSLPGRGSEPTVVRPEFDERVERFSR
jgi:hypothetical protein